jgi:hypothetical protein
MKRMTAEEHAKKYPQTAALLAAKAAVDAEKKKRQAEALLAQKLIAQSKRKLQASKLRANMSELEKRNFLRSKSERSS